MDRIYIPTLGRVDNQIFYNSIPDKWKKIITLVVQKDERDLHELDCDYFVTDNNIGLAKTEELILNSMLSISSGSSAANKIASISLSVSDMLVGKLITLFF